MRRNKISNDKLNKNAEIGSPWLASRSSINYFVVLLPLMTHDSWSFSKIITHKIKFWPKPYFYKVEIRKLWSIESKAFPMSIVTKKPSICLISVISISLKELWYYFWVYIQQGNWCPVFYESFISIFFSINLMIACLWEVLRCPISLASLTEFTKICKISYL